jgi:hypothetical protein
MQMDVLRQQIGKYRLWTSNVVQDTHTRHIQEVDLTDHIAHTDHIQEVDQDQEVDQEVDQVQRACQVWEVDLAVHLHTQIAHIQEVEVEVDLTDHILEAEAEVDQVLHLVTYQAILL